MTMNTQRPTVPGQSGPRLASAPACVLTQAATPYSAFPFLVAVIVAALVLCETAYAEVIFDNVNNEISGVEPVYPPRVAAQTIQTDSQSRLLESVTLLMSNPVAGNAVVDIHEGSLWEPLVWLGEFSPITAFPADLSLVVFEGSTPLLLLPNSTYWISLRAGSGDFNWAWTADNSGMGPAFSLTHGTSDVGCDGWYPYNNYPMQMSVSTSEEDVVTMSVAQVASLSVTLDLQGAGTDPFAIRITGDNGSADVACVDAYVQPDGSVGQAAQFQTLAAWGATVLISDEEIIPGESYTLATEGVPSNPVTVETSRWGDINQNGFVNLEDALLAVVLFQNGNSDAQADVQPCGGNDEVNLADLLIIVQIWQNTANFPTLCGTPCG